MAGVLAKARQMAEKPLPILPLKADRLENHIDLIIKLLKQYSSPYQVH